MNKVPSDSLNPDLDIKPKKRFPSEAQKSLSLKLTNSLAKSLFHIGSQFY